MEELSRWIGRRKVTFGLALFFCSWYAMQLVVFQWMGEEFAHWLFYFEQPPEHVSPGILLAPISHDFSTLTHISGNLFFLLIAGGLIEPYIGGRKVAVIVLGLGTLSIGLANSTAVFHKLWIIAGASGGVLALWAYAGIKKWGQALEYRDGSPLTSKEGVETMVAMGILVATPILPIYEAFVIGTFHSGHTIGIVLGLLTQIIEDRIE